MKLTRHKVLTAAEVARLQDFDNIAVKHLLGTNLGTPAELLGTLAKHSNFEVRTGVASNPKTPLLFSKSGKFSSVMTTSIF